MATGKTDIFQDIASLQKEICEKYSAEFTPTDLDLFVAISDNTDGDTFPINGLRLPKTGRGSGWFIWSGEDFPEDADYFKPMHGEHLKKRCAQVLQFFALPSGYRFIIDGEGNMNVSYDSELINN